MSSSAVGAAAWLLVSLWAVRRLTTVRWSIVFALWWALLWRFTLAGGIQFTVDRPVFNTKGTNADF